MSGIQVPDELTVEFVNACREVERLGLVRCSSGNMSRRIGDGLALLTASGAWLGKMEPGSVLICSIETGECVNGVKPTCESAFHLGILRARPECSVVLHHQSPFATAIACGDPGSYDFNVIVEVPVYIGKPAIVPYSPPGSRELADGIVSAMEKHELAILLNHGLVTVGRSYDDAIQKAWFFELACQILLSGAPINSLPAEAVAQLQKLKKG